ncbi:MAG: GNAT family N-acetyltransferase [Nitrospiraceae bacterium]
MSSSHAVPLRDADGSFVEAVLHERIGAGYALQVDDDWKTHLAAEEARAVAEGRAVPHLEHGHWEWGEKVKDSAHLLSCPTLAVECGGQTQGLMLVKTDGHFGMLPGEGGKPLVYLVYLATAPWNLRELAGQPRFAGVGLVLLYAAIQISLDAEFKGRIGLHSLPQAEGFYERHGFQCLGVDPEKEGLKYYELSPQAASEFIARSTS